MSRILWIAVSNIQQKQKLVEADYLLVNNKCVNVSNLRFPDSLT